MASVSRTARNPRATRQRAAISEALQEIEGFKSAQEMHDVLRGKGLAVGLTTVYRNLQALADRGEVDVVRKEDGESMYRRCDTGTRHHHHLVCRSCGFSVELENDDLESWTRATASRHRFSEVSHDLELFGLCEPCAVRRR